MNVKPTRPMVSSCRRKVGFPSHQMAMGAMMKGGNGRFLNCRIYKCKVCKQYHLGRNKYQRLMGVFDQIAAEKVSACS